MDYQWYPGHMTKAMRMMQEDIRLIDLVIELTDARLPLSSRNPDIDRLSSGKARILVLNKADLADDAVTGRWMKWFEEQGILAAKVNARRGEGIKQIQPLIEQACREKTERDRKRGILNRPLRTMVVGIPNVGKSTFINSFTGRSATKTGNRPGVTRGKQWIRLNKGVELLDTPGILWPKIEDQDAARKLAVMGTIRDEILDIQELALWLLSWMNDRYASLLKDRYGLEPSRDTVGELEEIARLRGCLGRNGQIDPERAGALIIDDFRKGKTGRISLEFPEER